MADESKTITIQFKGDTTNLDTSVANIDKAIRLLQSDTAAVQKQLKFGDTTGEQLKLYDQAISNVSQSIELAGKNMDYWNDAIKDFQDKSKITPLDEKEMNSMLHAQKMVAEYEKKVENLRSQLARLNNERVNYNRLSIADRLTKEGQKFERLGQAVGKVADSFKYISLGAGAALTASASAAITFETAMANVNKVLRDTEKDYFGTLEQQILDMSRVLPLTAQEIAQVTANALQLGISAKDVGTFTETILKLGTATNISADEAAIAIAQLFNITGEQYSNIEKFGAALTNLGNKFPTFESNIMEMASRIAAAGSSVGMTTKDILGLATALSSMGLNAESGGTAISTILRNIDTAVATSSKQLTAWANKVGMTNEQFKQAWSKDATWTFKALINSIAKSVDKGKNLNTIMNDLGITAVRQKDAFSRLVQANDTLNDALNESARAWNAVAKGEDGALNNEFAERVKTLASQFQLLKNELYYVGVQIGNFLMPVLRKVVDAVRQVVDWFINLSPAAKEWIAKLLTGVAAIYPALKGLSLLITGIGKMLTGLGGIIGTKLIPDGFGEKIFGGILKSVKLFAKAATTPITGWVAAIVASFAILYKTFKPFRDAINGLADSFKNNLALKTKELLTIFKQLGDWLVKTLLPVFDKMKELYHRFIEPTLSYLYTALAKFLFKAIEDIYSLLIRLIGWLAEFLKPAIEIVLKLIQAVITFITPLVAWLFQVLGAVIELVNFIWNKAKPYIVEVLDKVGGFIEWLSPLASDFFNMVLDSLQWVLDRFADLYSYLEDTGVIYTFSEAFSTITGALKAAWEWLEKIVNALNKWAGDAPTLDQMRKDWENQTGQRAGSTGVMPNIFNINQRNTFNGGNTAVQATSAANNMLDLINDGLGKKLTW